MPNEGFVPVPSRLRDYEKLWKKMYGAETPDENITELEAIARDLSTSDPEFKKILADCEATRTEKDNRGWTLVEALSTYGKKFGLKVD